MINESRERFLRSIVEQVPLARIVEIHFFPPIRQVQMETGVAVIAAEQEVTVEEPSVEESGVADSAAQSAPDSPTPDSKLVVYTASYRWTRKGPERGKWVVEVVAEADAPLLTVEKVVRGVQERSGEGLDAERLTHTELERILPPEPGFVPVPAAGASPESTAA